MTPRTLIGLGDAVVVELGPKRRRVYAVAQLHHITPGAMVARLDRRRYRRPMMAEKRLRDVVADYVAKRKGQR